MKRLERFDETVRALAREELLTRFRALSERDVHVKRAADGSDEIVTVADRAMERRLVPALEALLPGSVVVGEEETSASPERLGLLRGDAPVWVVDPLDGTLNFARGNPEFGVMVALVEQGQTREALIHHPMRGSTWIAALGQGARLSGASIPVQPDRASPLGAVYGSGPGHDRLRRSNRVQVADTLGSAASEYASIADGSRDFVVFASRLMPWDHAPGTLIVQELGGVARSADGDDYRAAGASLPLIVARDQATWLVVQSTLCNA